MDLYEAMRCAPTTRRFSNEPVPREMLARALDAARFAPSGGNRQGWRVIAVQDPELRRKLGELYLPHWRAYVRRLGMEEVLEDPDADPVMRAAHRGRRPVRPQRWPKCPCTWSWACAWTTSPSPTPSCRAAASSAAPRSTRSSRTSCWRCARRASGPR